MDEQDKIKMPYLPAVDAYKNNYLDDAKCSLLGVISGTNNTASTLSDGTSESILFAIVQASMYGIDKQNKW